ncbi:hypothetical protein [Nannocystis punicea]|uniref:Uncharacterized protein n=1 Tax=Nannocystis punicea TaxID=2995304 RepID=A0ABY7HD18_9BACT|nr:hypothetical protein [Nannocystis poenicansa]WAS97185.1 hypothetical protein O0S08_13640 [Nannocystis poenicansa]
MDERALSDLCDGLEALLRRLHPDGSRLDLASARAEFATALAAVDDERNHDVEAASQGSLTRADALRIRSSKFVASLLPPGMFADPAVRREIARTVRALAEAALGPLAASRYLDRG